MPEFFRKAAVVLLAGSILAGCGTAYYKQSADKEVYGIISAKGDKVGGMPSDFTIQPEEHPACKLSATSPSVLSLEDALGVGFDKSREYQRQKEGLYSQGLALTLSRHEFDPIFSGTASGEFDKEAVGNNVSGVLTFGLSKMLSTGADLSVSMTTLLFRSLSGADLANSATSLISASIVQPLLKGGGRTVALENLTQAERDMAYAIRNFVRYRKTLSVDITKSYYELLRQEDQLRNAYNNYQNLKMELERARLMAMAGRLPEFQVDQTEQDELSARDGWVRAKETYENLLDAFKFQLGVPTNVLIEPNPADMQKLAGEITSPTITVEEAEAIAMENRLDLKTKQDMVEDTRRKVEVAANALKPGLDVFATAEVPTEGQNRPLAFDTGNGSYSAGANVELPFDKKAERNAYRQSLINAAASERDLSESTDRIKVDIRTILRNIAQAEESYQIQKNSLNLAERRVESTDMLHQAGRASTRDVLEARDALLQAQNAVTSALVEHFNARLDLLLAMETLKVDDNGLWIEDHEIKPDAEVNREG